MSERRGDKLTVLENRNVGMCALGHDVAILGTVLLEQAASYLNSLVAARVDCSLSGENIRYKVDCLDIAHFIADIVYGMQLHRHVELCNFLRLYVH